MSAAASIVFLDELGVRWTVTVHGGDAVIGWAAVDFISDRGERRTSECCAPDHGTWADVEEATWRTLLSHAKAPGR